MREDDIGGDGEGNRGTIWPPTDGADYLLDGGGMPNAATGSGGDAGRVVGIEIGLSSTQMPREEISEAAARTGAGIGEAATATGGAECG